MNEIHRALVKATENIANEFGIKFCTNCNLTKPAEGGKVKKVTNNRTRWLCASCAQKKKPQGFKNKL